MHVSDLTFTYPSRTNPAIDEISFDVERGEIVGLFGPNGCGKTTLLRCMAGLERGWEGRIELGGESLSEMRHDMRSREIAYIPQDAPKNVPYSARGVVLMGRYHAFRMNPSEDDVSRTEETMRRLDISGLGDEVYCRLSGGQRQLVNIARAVNQDTSHILLDEPTSNLDFSKAHLIWTILSKMRDEGRSIVVSSHDPNHISRYCDKVAVINGGKLVSFGPPSESMTDSVMEGMFETKIARREMIAPE